MIDPRELRPYAERDLERECYWLHLTEDQASALAGGYVSTGVKSVLRELLDYDLEDLKRSERPVQETASPRARKGKKCGTAVEGSCPA